MYKKVIISIFLLSLAGCNSKNKSHIDIRLDTNTVAAIVFTDNCSYDTDIYYQTGKKRLYLNCLDNFDIIIDKEKMPLKEYLDSSKISLDEIIENFTQSFRSTIDERENSIYEDDYLTVYICNEGNGSYNKDILISPTIYTKNENIKKFCNYNQSVFSITAHIEKRYEDSILVKDVEHDRESYIITRIDVFESDLLAQLIEGKTIEFLYSGSKDLSDPPIIQALEIRIID